MIFERKTPGAHCYIIFLSNSTTQFRYASSPDLSAGRLRKNILDGRVPGWPSAWLSIDFANKDLHRFLTYLTAFVG